MCAQICTVINEHSYKSNIYRHMYTYIYVTPYSCTHILTDTEDPAVPPAEAPFFLVLYDGVQTVLESACPLVPQCSPEPSLLLLTPSSAGFLILGSGTAASTLGLCCCRAAGNPSTGLPPQLLHSMTYLSASAAQVPTFLHPRLESSEGDKK